MQIESVRVLYDGWSKCLLLTVRTATGETRSYQAETHGDSAAVLPYDPSRRVATVVLQSRPPLIFAGEEARLLEVPAGLTDGEGPVTAARRETLEETGLEVLDLEYVGRFWMLPGISTERMHMYLAAYTGNSKVAAGGGIAAEGEDIEVREIPLAELALMADSSQLSDMKTFAALQTLRLRRPDLFVG